MTTNREHIVFFILFLYSSLDRWPLHWLFQIRDATQALQERDRSAAIHHQYRFFFLNRWTHKQVSLVFHTIAKSAVDMEWDTVITSIMTPLIPSRLNTLPSILSSHRPISPIMLLAYRLIEQAIQHVRPQSAENWASRPLCHT
jgi:hypothetical protein